MYRRGTPNEFATVRTSLGSHNKIFRTGDTAREGSGLASIGPGPSGSAFSRAMRRYAVGSRIRFDSSMAGSGGASGDGGRSMSKNSKGGDDDGAGASGKSKSLSFIYSKYMYEKFSINWNTAYLIQPHLNVILLPSIYRHPAPATQGAVVRAGCLASCAALCTLSLCRRFVLVLLTFLKRSLCDLF